MTTQTWLPLTDYSLKYKVSISTLRRRIKSEKIQFRSEDGKYFLLDTPPDRQFDHEEDIQLALPNVVPPPTHSAPRLHHSTPYLATARHVSEPPPVFESTNKALLEELKKAYSVIFQEKDDQIVQLKGEIADLRTLVRVLEAENKRLQKSKGKPEEGLPERFY